jgi:hypothetical protein
MPALNREADPRNPVNLRWSIRGYSASAAYALAPTSFATAVGFALRAGS